MADLSLSISALATRITFQQPTISEDPGGAQVPSWSNIANTPSVWSQWVNAHGQEAVQSDMLQSTQRAVVTIRYRSDVKETWRVLKDGEAWQILSVDQVRDRNRWTELVVERVKGTV